MSSTPHLFYGEIQKGYFFKVMIDVLSSSLKRFTLGFTKEGIVICQANDEQTMLFKCIMERSKFMKYMIKPGDELLLLSVNAGHIRKQLRTIKKKDKITIFVPQASELSIFVTITPDTSDKGVRSETISVVAQKEQKLISSNPPPASKYYHPLVIESGGFQRIKKQISYTKNIIIEMNTDGVDSTNYLSFYCDGGSVYTSKISFGEEPATKSYTGAFNYENINALIKLPGLNKQMQFYSPKSATDPLKIHVDAENIGNFEVFITRIASSDEDADEVEEEIPVRVRGRKGA